MSHQKVPLCTLRSAHLAALLRHYQTRHHPILHRLEIRGESVDLGAALRLDYADRAIPLEVGRIFCTYDRLRPVYSESSALVLLPCLRASLMRSVALRVSSEALSAAVSSAVFTSIRPSENVISTSNGSSLAEKLAFLCLMRTRRVPASRLFSTASTCRMLLALCSLKALPKAVLRW